MDEYIVISDLHLGSDVCRADNILEFLYYLETENLILNGDIFDNMDFRRLNKSHWHILKKLRQISKNTNLIWISGNHDFECEPIAHLIGAEWKLDYLIQQDQRKIYLTHGDRFDKIISKRPLLTRLADNVYRIVQLYDRFLHNDYYFSRWLKQNSKTLIKSTKNTIKSAIIYCSKNKYSAIILGHLHKAEHLTLLDTGLEYINSGCWTEKECHYVAINNGDIHLKKFTPTEVPQRDKV